MRSNKILQIVLIIILLFAVSMAFSANPFKYKGLTWAVGQWASYKMKMDTTENNVKYSIVGSEVVKGKTCYWFEMKTEMPQGNAIVKFLIAPGEKPQKFYMKSGNQPAMDMTEMMNSGNQKQQAPVRTDDEINAGYLGVEAISVPAGSFRAVHTKLKGTADNPTETDAYVSEKVPVVGIVKSIGKSKRRGEEFTFTLTLTAYGTSGAKTEITETPQKFNMPTMRRGTSIPKK